MKLILESEPNKTSLSNYCDVITEDDEYLEDVNEEEDNDDDTDCSLSTMVVQNSSNLHISFAGCGFLGTYHVGVIQCLMTHGKGFMKRVRGVGGASAGALVAATLLCSPKKLNDAMQLCYNIADTIQSKPLGALTPNFNMSHTLSTELDTLLPPNAHTMASGRLFISLTMLKNRKNIVISQFESRDELIQALLCSCFIPVYSGMKTPTFRGKKCMDGGMSWNQPAMPSGKTIFVSPFCGTKQQICPRDETWFDLSYDIFGHSFKFSAQNVVRGVQALFPPHRSVLEKYYQKGVQDARVFLFKNKLYEQELDTDLGLE
ncbi:patatin-like phospholipase domain-containing protein 4 [Anneissia japonica]|uniref:patatin-like phospholipase domain-containing protein 4 n=1 Tax=Anneissia japonica TaxID=1529436 RepID=UPI0014257A17|nr:patatin-like phospholipase domain-containing protein 4 [Anneissia japonica]XP_033121152.1 patatin-like phospholipase domain-containing protein 4 [Anneissia japonica]